MGYIWNFQLNKCYIHTHTYTHIYIYTLCVCMCIHTHIYKYININTHTHTHINTGLIAYSCPGNENKHYSDLRHAVSL